MKSIYKIAFIGLLLFSSLLKAQQPNIVWITSEDNSTHYMKLFDEHGVASPNIEMLAQQGIVFDRAFSNAAVCSAARSTLILSSYGPRLATHYHRAEGKITLNNSQEMFPAYLKKAGYHTTNNSKEDYNIIKPDNVWDDSSRNATWRDRKEGQPFFHVHNIETTHESRVHFSKEDMQKVATKTPVDDMFVFPNHPQTELLKYTNAHYRDKIQQMDAEVGEVVNELKKDGLLENTIIFYYGDHGGVLPGSKGYLYEAGLHVPLVVYVPEKYKNLSAFAAGSRTNAFVSFVDFGATVLNLAGVEVPKSMDGNPFLGANISLKEVEKRDETVGYADRFDEKYDMVRSFRKGKYKYIRNFQPFNVDGLMNVYRYKQLAYQEWKQLFDEGKLNEVQAAFFKPKHVEALYDLEADPYETNNLATNKAYESTLKSLRGKLVSWMKENNDLSVYPEFYLLENAIQNSAEFGKTHSKNISKYIDVANIALLDFNKASKKISKCLASNDPWERYWAINACSSFGKQASAFSKVLESISTNDTELVNRVAAAEYLGLIGAKNPMELMLKAVYQSKKETEALFILNAVVLMRDFYQKYDVKVDENKLDAKVKADKLVVQRIEYINGNK